MRKNSSNLLIHFRSAARVKAFLVPLCFAAFWIVFSTRNINAATIPLVGELDCSAGSACTISGIDGNPLFSGSASTGDVLDITFANGAFFQPILDDQSLMPWEVTMVGQGTNLSDDFGVRMHLSDVSGDPATGSAGLSLNGLLSGVGGDGVSFVSLPIFVYDVHIEIRQNSLTELDGTALFTMNWFRIVDKGGEGPQITFQQGPQSAVPLPAALPLFASGLGVMGLLVLRRKRKARAAQTTF